MSAIHTIRRRLGVTQVVLSDALGVTQGNVSNYERGQTVPPAVAAKLIEFAATRGVQLSFDDVYADEAPATASDAAAGA